MSNGNGSGNGMPESAVPLHMKKLNGNGSPGDSSSLSQQQFLSKSRASSLRKHLSHSISEENDEIIYAEMSPDGLDIRRMNRLLSESSDGSNINKSKVNFEIRHQFIDKLPLNNRVKCHVEFKIQPLSDLKKLNKIIEKNQFWFIEVFYLMPSQETVFEHGIAINKLTNAKKVSIFDQ